jgi:hypothetical protein
MQTEINIGEKPDRVSLPTTLFLTGAFPRQLDTLNSLSVVGVHSARRVKAKNSLSMVR